MTALGSFSYVRIDRNIAASESALLIQTENNAGRCFEVATSGTTRIGGTLPGSPKISLLASGEAVFGNRVQLGPNWSNNNVSGIRLALGSNNGTLLIKGKIGTSDAISVRAGGNGSANATATINMDGSATFSSVVKSESPSEHFLH